MSRDEYLGFLTLEEPKIKRKESCNLNDVHDFGCQIIDDVKNNGWEQGLIVCIKQNVMGNWLCRIMGNIKDTTTASWAVDHLIQSLNDEFVKSGMKLKVVRDE
jgi:hypothetical protein